MKVDSFLNVLRSRRRTVDRREDLERYSASAPWYRRWLNRSRGYLQQVPIVNNAKWVARRWPSRRDGRANSDFFWSFEAVRFWPEFRVAPADAGLRFAFEAAPRVCFERNGYRMPFGCHGWAKYDRSFWEPHLLPDVDAASGAVAC